MNAAPACYGAGHHGGGNAVYLGAFLRDLVGECYQRLCIFHGNLISWKVAAIRLLVLMEMFTQSNKRAR